MRKTKLYLLLAIISFSSISCNKINKEDLVYILSRSIEENQYSNDSVFYNDQTNELVVSTTILNISQVERSALIDLFSYKEHARVKCKIAISDAVKEKKELFQKANIPIRRIFVFEDGLELENDLFYTNEYTQITSVKEQLIATEYSIIEQVISTKHNLPIPLEDGSQMKNIDYNNNPYTIIYTIELENHYADSFDNYTIQKYAERVMDLAFHILQKNYSDYLQWYVKLGLNMTVMIYDKRGNELCSITEKV